MIQIKRLISSVAVGALAFLPLIASAQTAPFAEAARRVGNTQTSAGFQSSTGPDQLTTMIGRIINVILGFLGIVLLFYVLMAGFKWMTAGGNSKQTDEARDMIKNAVIGMVIIVAGFAISNFVIAQLANLAAA